MLTHVFCLIRVVILRIRSDLSHICTKPANEWVYIGHIFPDPTFHVNPTWARNETHLGRKCSAYITRSEPRHELDPLKYSLLLNTNTNIDNNK